MNESKLQKLSNDELIVQYIKRRIFVIDNGTSERNALILMQIISEMYFRGLFA